jgi:glucose-1-phosphate cytidylyltransferase
MTRKHMKLAILCGGLGTRLREQTEFRPKPMVDVGGRPILWHILKMYAHHGLRDFVLCLGYKGEVIKEYFLNYEAMNNDFTMSLGRRSELTYHGEHNEQDFHVTLAETGQNTMTGGRLKRAAKYLTDRSFLMTYGDGLANVNIARLLDFHSSHGKLATITTVKPVSRYGIVHLEPGGAISSFAEKPQIDGWVNAGFCVLDRGVLDYISGDDCMLEREPFEMLAREGQLMAFQHEGFFYAMDTYRDYQHLNDLWASGNAPWKCWQ